MKSKSDVIVGAKKWPHAGPKIVSQVYVQYELPGSETGNARFYLAQWCTFAVIHERYKNPLEVVCEQYKLPIKFKAKVVSGSVAILLGGHSDIKPRPQFLAEESFEFINRHGTA